MRSWTWMVLVVAMVMPTTGSAQDQTPGLVQDASVPSSGWAARWENDSFADGDGNYTNGLDFRWLQRVKDSGGYLLGGSDALRTTGWAISQILLTPTVITGLDRHPGDRPFGAYLSGSRLMRAMDVLGSRWDSTIVVDLEELVEVDLGLTGRAAFGATAQSGMHVLRESRLPKGWSGQGRTDVAGNVRYVARLGLHLLAEDPRLVISVVPNAGLSIGTIQTSAHVGGSVSLGFGIDDRPPSAIPSTEFMPPPKAQATPPGQLGFAVFASAERRWIGHNYFMDGSVWRGGPTVERESYGSHIRVGGTVRFDPWALSYSLTVRRPELIEPTFRRPHEFGAFTLSRRTGVGHRTIGRWIDDLLDRLEFEVGLGAGSARLPGSVGGAAKNFGPSMAASVAWRIPRRERLALAFDLSGVGRPDLRAGRDTLVDHFARTVGGSLRVSLLDRKSRWGYPELGLGLAAATVHRQDVEPMLLDEEKWDERLDGTVAFLLDARYLVPATDQIQVGLRAGWAEYVGEKAAHRHSRYVNGLLFIRWTPKGRGS